MTEKPIDPRIDEALKKCNPQKAIYALAEVENEVIDQLTTTEGTLNTRMDGIETDMDNLEASVNTRITEIEGVANEANTKADNAVTTANQANATANTALTNSETTQTNLTALQGVVNTAYDTVGTTESTSTVNIDLTTIGGQKESAALPVASAGKAGVINTSDYIKFEGYDARIKSLEGQSITYLVQFPNNNPTQAEITAAYRAQYPNAPFPPLDSTVLMDTANELSYRWFENSQTWSKISAEPIGLFTLQKEGLIKGSDKVGEVYPNADGTGAVNGWDALGTRVTNAEAAITANTNLANSKGAQLNSGATATGVNVNLLNTAGTQIGTTALPVASEAQAGIISAASYNAFANATEYAFKGNDSGYGITSSNSGLVELTINGEINITIYWKGTNIAVNRNSNSTFIVSAEWNGRSDSTGSFYGYMTKTTEAQKFEGIASSNVTYTNYGGFLRLTYWSISGDTASAPVKANILLGYVYSRGYYRVITQWESTKRISVSKQD